MCVWVRQEGMHVGEQLLMLFVQVEVFMSITKK